MNSIANQVIDIPHECTFEDTICAISIFITDTKGPIQKGIVLWVCQCFECFIYRDVIGDDT